MSKELLAINVNEHVEKKGQLSYLSWAWAWAEVLKIDPSAEWSAVEYEDASNCHMPCMFLPDGTAMVKTLVQINGKIKTCTLPVMDNKNNAIKNPDARKISDAIMRCMTKAIAMHGLGLYIYAGEDLPQVETEDPNAEKFAVRTNELEEFALHLIDCHENGKDLDVIRLWYDAASWRDDDPFDANEERKIVWNKLPSKLRNQVIKPNDPHNKPAA